LSFSKQPPEDGSLTPPTGCIDLQGTEWGAKGSLNGALLLR
jgi:hypothetical protein